MNGLALCAGVGGLELGLRLALGSRYRTVGYVEREACAAAVLVARMEDQALDRAPVWDDVATFDGRPWRGKVDLVSSGIPCQPYSVAGSGRGHADERALWPHLVRVVGECEPGLVFIENVPPFLKHFEPVWRELRGMGFEFAPPMLRTASESGAPHIRRRLFVLAAHSSRRRADAIQLAGQLHRAEPLGVTPPVSDRGRREGEWCGWVLDGERATLRHDPDGRGCGCRAKGTPWATESPVLRVADGSSDRVDRLRAIGNGVVPAVAAAAFLEMVQVFA